MRSITEAEFEAAMSSLGGYSKEQLAIIGVPWPPPTAWKSRIQAQHKLFSKDQIDRFVRYHLNNKDADEVFGKPLAVIARDDIENSLSQIGHIKTYTGKIIQPLAMTEDDLDIHDIAHALARVCRFAGHCRGFMSVASHSVRVLKRVIEAEKRRHPEIERPSLSLLDLPTLRSALLHDASETYLGDLPRPLKRHPAFAFYRQAEERIEHLIARKFGCAISGGIGLDAGKTWPSIVHECDNLELEHELKITRYSPATDNIDVAEAEFLRRWEELKP